MLRGSQNREKSQKSIQVILRQIDILNDIAGSFSNFAKMPAPEITSLNVSELLRKKVGLYSNHSDAHINCELPKDIFVKGDESIILRAFSNVILNSIQSKHQLNAINLNITVSHNLKDCIISFRDNGVGISDENKENVFRPYFTTKSSGAGLGLAIVKQTLELCNSSIWFETEIGRGTVFYIQLPLDGADKLI
jgi:signal transduction histidine kinase